MSRLAILSLFTIFSFFSAPKAEAFSTNTTVVTDTATFGTGCFWCTEAIFQQVEGVISVSSGYSGGHTVKPSYKEVCSGTTGHAECLEIVFDPKKVSYETLLEMFWQSHDPTTLNRQGNDIGTQYRSVIFYHNAKQKALAEKYKALLNTSGAFDKPIVTTLEPFTRFYIAENYHQDYFNQHGEEPYCQYIIRPKVDKFRKVFKNKLKH
ncbi:peptide-methionine (S)-S-oxide reductase MsrA [Ferruginibacter sp. HRS2-29]|uniref:peptide-methionine (S)-S-oxide reductase MsrA n=1 Tax=Ferruginibacter sp. HRS2-29 TaxID=2487334 RepID=UPI0020CD8A8E|nr:peptide-methionine (S)-S-oxide reductase MsrA [Ferruginibacter sp. HRS2-29]MCP9750355.1 peptide-methionine (S)-S-oxide reductase [Ferruginibacter sp. HRS2-29]